VRLWREEPIENRHGGGDALRQSFPEGRYEDLAGLCKAATRDEIEKQGWSLNPGRYVGVIKKEELAFDFKGRFEALNEELERLNAEARELEDRISANAAALMEAAG
jgi:type I restriction enzyme M protein